MGIRYDTLVIEGADGKEFPREAAGGKVVGWAKGHALAKADALEEFMQALVDGEYEVLTYDEIVITAQEALDKARQHRDNGYAE